MRMPSNWPEHIPADIRSCPAIVLIMVQASVRLLLQETLAGLPGNRVSHPGVVHFLDPYRYRSTFHQNRQISPMKNFAQITWLTWKRSSPMNAQIQLPRSCWNPSPARTESSFHRMDIFRGFEQFVTNMGSYLLQMR